MKGKKGEGFRQLWEQLDEENRKKVSRLVDSLLQVDIAEREALHALVDALPADCLHSAREGIRTAL